ncbi:MAG: efflux RND transporter periplasmic adaptor subunit [Burkholderiales bacterium]|nr:efflux RND transporter periplasmic adaptor subunit [Opitutaceae bacterium]
MKRLLWIFAALGLLALCIGWVVRARAAADQEKVVYTYAKPERRDLKQTVVINGTIAPVLSTEIRSEVSGRIAKVLVEAGAEVTLGQPLIELDQSTLQVQLDDARLGVAGARLRTERAELEYKRLQSLADRALVTEKERKEAEIAFRLAENDTASQQARVRLLENSLGKGVISAPYAGRVLSLAARPGMIVTGADAGREGNTLLELADISRLRVEASINEIDVAVLTLGMPVDITFESVPEAKASGRITFIAPAAGKAAGGGSASGSGGGGNSSGARDFPLQISIEESHPRVRPGMTARVHIETAAAAQALSVEHNAVFNDYATGDWFVFVRPAGAKAEPVQTKVELGVRDAKHVEIKSGLTDTAEVSLQRPPAVKFSQDK